MMMSCGGLAASSRDENCALNPLTENRRPYDVLPVAFTEDTGSDMALHVPETGDGLVPRTVAFQAGCVFHVTLFSAHVVSSECTS